MFLSLIKIAPIPEKRDKILEMLASVARHSKAQYTAARAARFARREATGTRSSTWRAGGDREKRCNAMFDPTCTSAFCTPWTLQASLRKSLSMRSPERRAWS